VVVVVVVVVVVFVFVRLLSDTKKEALQAWKKGRGIWYRSQSWFMATTEAGK